MTRTRPRRKGPGPALTSLALLAVVVGMAYLYYETPNALGGDPPAAPAARLAPILAWTQDVSFPADPAAVSLGVGIDAVLVVGSDGTTLWARWFDRFGFATAEAEWAGPFHAWAAAGSTLVVARASTSAASDAGSPAEIVFLDPENLPGGQAWSTGRASAGASLAPMGAGAVAVAAYGGVSGADLHPDLLIRLERAPVDGAAAPTAAWRPSWSTAYETERLLQIVAGPDLVGALVLDPGDARPYRVELRERDGRRAWQVSIGEEGLLLTAALAAEGPPAVAALAGTDALVIGADGVRGRATFETAPTACWPAGSARLACAGTAEGVPWFAFVDGRGHAGPRSELAPGGLVRPLPGTGVLTVEGRRLRAWGPSGERWSVDLPFEPLTVEVGDQGLAAANGSRLAWLTWPEADRP